MKYVILVCDGMADEPIEAIGGRTPAQVAKTPNMDKLAKTGTVGRVQFVPEGMYPGSDVANMAILGYDPKEFHTGRAPLEAANLGIKLAPHEVAFRCNFVTASDGTMVDFAGGHIGSREAKILVEELNKALGTDKIKFHPGVSYRQILVISDPALTEDLVKTDCTPPHDLTGKKYGNNMPKGKAAKFLTDLMEKSRAVLEKHDMNKVRIDLKENPANMIWLWGQGKTPSFTPLKEKYGIKGSMISAVDLLNGIGGLLGMEVIKVPGATGYYDTNFVGKAEYGVEALKRVDLSFVHVEAADEAGHNGDLKQKIRAIENFDSQVVGTVLEKMKNVKDWRLLICPDHPTPVALRTHTNTPVLFLMHGAGVPAAGNAQTFDEVSAAASPVWHPDGHKLMAEFLKK